MDLFDADTGHETMDDEGEIFILQMFLEEEFHERLFRTDSMKKNIETSSERQQGTHLLHGLMAAPQTSSIETIRRIHVLAAR